MIERVSKALSKRGEGEKGFTLVELLVVVIIIGILAAIAVPIFLNQRKGAWRSSVESDVKNASLAVETATTQNNGKVDGLTFPDTENGAGNITKGSTSTDGLATVTVSPDNTVKIEPDGTNGYKVTGTNTNLGTETYVYESSKGTGSWS